MTIWHNPILARLKNPGVDLLGLMDAGTGFSPGSILLYRLSIQGNGQNEFIDMPDGEHSAFRDKNLFRRRKAKLSARLGMRKRSIVEAVADVLRRFVRAGLLGAAAFLLCQCHRQPSPPQPAIATPASTVTPTPPPVTITPPAVTPTPAASPTASASPSPQPTPSSTPDAFAEGIKHLLAASGKGFLEFRGKFKRTENGSGPNALFRIRKIYEGTFLLGDAASAEIEEVYYEAREQPVYNYHLYYQALSPQVSIERYSNLRMNLNRVLEDFEHTFGDRYDAWARDDPLKTAILLSSQDQAGSPEIQVHAAPPSPQW
jgi:hypothetical protein